ETEEDKRYWSKSELELFPLVQELHRVVRSYTGSEKEYKEYINSVKNSVLTAFYTPAEITKSIASSLSEAGIQAQNILDPSAGSGQFIQDFKVVFPKSNVVAYEKDLITGKILQCLYPDEKIHAAGFETVPANRNGYFDVVTSNIPFGDISVPDADFLLDKNSVRQFAARHVHNYFFLKGMDTLREGGILAFITSQGVADAPTNKPIREWLMHNANLVSAVRLPNNLFLENAGTEVGSDLIILQKNTRKTALSDNEKLFIEATQTKTGIGINKYIYNRTNLIFTDTTTGTDPYGKPAVILTHSGGITGIAGDLHKNLIRDFSERLNLNLYQQYSPAAQVIAFMQTQLEPKRQQQQQPVQAKSAEALPTLYDLFDQVETPKPTVPQIKYTGKIAKHHKPGSLVKNEQADIVVLSINENNEFIVHPLQDKDSDKEKIAQYIDVRDAYYNLYTTEQITQTKNHAGRERLNQLYDNFVSQYGTLNDKNNRVLIDMDTNRVEILAIERQDGKDFVKSDIFDKPVAFTHVTITTAEDALLASLDRYNEVRIDFISRELNISGDETLQQLEHKIFYNPLCKTNFEIAGKFLSGNIVEKIDALSDFAHKNGETAQLRKSITALQNVIPEKIPFELLEFNFGERWLPTSVYNTFATHLFKTGTEVRYYTASDEFIVKPQNYTAEIYNKYNVRTDSRNYNGVKLMQYALHNTMPNVTKTVEVNGEERKVRDTQSIQRINAKIEEIRNEFTVWLKQQPQTVKDEICDLYNRKFNCFVKATYDGTHQTMPGLSFEKFKYRSLYDSQKNAVWMLKQNGGGIIDHEVGGGKTLIMCCAAHEMKRMGIAMRPIIIGLKANIQAIAETYRDAYPDAKILYPG
ncbi:MAG: DNA methylase, partial [Tannerella sp.]|nr:DNA methylase [Tannerella sp.]